jgi:hypothetical protein
VKIEIENTNDINDLKIDNLKGEGLYIYKFHFKLGSQFTSHDLNLKLSLTLEILNLVDEYKAMYYDISHNYD